MRIVIHQHENTAKLTIFVLIILVSYSYCFILIANKKQLDPHKSVYDETADYPVEVENYVLAEGPYQSAKQGEVYQM